VGARTRKKYVEKLFYHILLNMRWIFFSNKQLWIFLSNKQKSDYFKTEKCFQNICQF